MEGVNLIKTPSQLTGDYSLKIKVAHQGHEMSHMFSVPTHLKINKRLYSSLRCISVT
jgi:hypothetical protein